MGQWVGAQGRTKVAYFSKTCPICDVTSRKPSTETENCFFNFTRLAESVEGLNNSQAQSPSELQDCKVLQEKWRMRDLRVEQLHTRVYDRPTRIAEVMSTTRRGSKIDLFAVLRFYVVLNDLGYAYSKSATLRSL